jgi:hypothetical protein
VGSRPRSLHSVCSSGDRTGATGAEGDVLSGEIGETSRDSNLKRVEKDDEEGTCFTCPRR